MYSIIQFKGSRYPMENEKNELTGYVKVLSCAMGKFTE
jgi:hypothetical protein